MNTPLHPLKSVLPSEITAASKLVNEYNAHLGKKIVFKVIALKEPPKAHVVPYLIAEAAGQPLPTPSNRVLFARFYFYGEASFYEALADVTAGKVVSQEVLSSAFHGQGEIDEIGILEKIASEAPETKAEVERLKLPPGTTIVCEPWPYGSDGDNDEKRMWQVYFYISGLGGKKHPDFNHYSLPLDFSVVIDDLTKKVVRVEHLPLKFDGTLPTKDTPWTVAPGAQYAPDLIKDEIRKDLKPLIVSQPEGPSFKIEGEKISWQKWTFHMSFNYREGMVLRDVKYDGRPTFYRLSLSEMNVPYGDPRRPYTRKSAFDLGDIGAGVTANNLKLGCDCLGSIAYLDGWVSNQAGEAVHRPNAICVHEQDAGVGWKHTNFRNGAAKIVRKRELVMQMILTVANYEYGLYWILSTDGEIAFEVRATGIMSTVPVSHEETTCDFGILVTPGCFAPVHQHIFVVRMDPAIDGYTGTQVVLEETVPMEKDERNPWGIGFKTVRTPVTHAGTAETNPSANRVVKLINPAKINPTCHLPVSYKFTPLATQMLLAHPESYNYKRAEFAKHPLYWTTYSDEELYAGSVHTNQSRGGEGIEKWVGRGDELKDPVVWHTFGLTHIPRLEDWPVMPVEIHRFSIKPVNFHAHNPALDMPQSTQEVNKSTLVGNSGPNGGACH